MMDSQDSLIAHQVPVTPLLLRDSRSNGVIFEVPSLQLSPYPTIPVVFKSEIGVRYYVSSTDQGVPQTPSRSPLSQISDKSCFRMSSQDQWVPRTPRDANTYSRKCCIRKNRTLRISHPAVPKFWDAKSSKPVNRRSDIQRQRGLELLLGMQEECLSYFFDDDGIFG